MMRPPRAARALLLLPALAATPDDSERARRLDALLEGLQQATP